MFEQLTIVLDSVRARFVETRSDIRLSVRLLLICVIVSVSAK